MHDPEILNSLHLARFQVEPVVFAAPGRVNLIGEHTDYAEGFVMPAAIDFATLAGISPRTDGKIVIYSENYKEDRTFDADDAAYPWLQTLERLSDGSGHNSCRRRAQDSRFQPEPPRRRASRGRLIQFSRG